MSKKLFYLMTFVLALFLPVSSAGAAEFLIDNPGFEIYVLGDGGWDYLLDNEGWGYFDNGGNLGAWNPQNADYIGEAPEGQNVGWSETTGGVPGGFAQVLLDPDAVLKLGTYTLTVKVGAARTYSSGGYIVQLLAGGTPHTPGIGTDWAGPVTGGTLLAQDDNSLHPIKAGSFETVTVRYTYDAAAHSALLGEPMQIRLLARPGGDETEFDDVKLSWEGPTASNPYPPNNAVDVPVDANLSWDRGKFCIQDEVYFGTDPVMGNLPKVATLSAASDDPMWNPPGDLIASTTYYWYVVETDSNKPHTPHAPWSFTTVRGEAQCDYPFDGAIIEGDEMTYLGEDYIWTQLVFIPGPTAIKHTSYFSEDYSKVDGRAQDANLGEPPFPSTSGWEYTYFAGNPQVPPATDSLVRGTKYYWTVDETDALGNVFGGDIWEFTIQDYYAFSPSPPNEAMMISTDVLLRWLPGVVVEDHDIYMGTSWEDVNNAVYSFDSLPPEHVATRSEPNYQASGLPFETKLYWRVDQVSGRLPPSLGTVYKGNVWCFTTQPKEVGTIREDLWWNILGDAIANLYNDPRFPANPDETRSLTMFDSGGGLGDNYGGMIHGWLHPAKSGDYRFWIAADDTCELFLSTDHQPANMQRIAYAPGWLYQYEWNWYTSQRSTLIPLVAGRKYYIRACWKEGSGGDHCEVAWQGPDQPIAPLYGSAAAVINGNRLSPFVQLWAHSPDPMDSQASVPAGAYTLRWGPGDHAAQHDVYFGTDKAAVTNATPTTPGIYKGRIGPNSLSVTLAAAQFYHWRVDEVNVAGPDPGLWKGATWTFRTEGAAGGLRGLYYHWDGYQPDLPVGPPNPFQIFVMSRIDPEVDFNWGQGTPDPSVNTNYFACRWVGHVECPVDANYTFTTECDDGARLFVDDQQVIPTGAWSQGGMRFYSGDIVLSAGLHDIEMHMYEREGGAGARLRWSATPTNPSDDPIPQQIIPAMWLWPSLFASGPRPPDGSISDDRTPALEWIAGFYADYHELYFSENFDDVNNRNPAVKQTLGDPCHPYPAVPPLELGKTYYWCVDEVKISPADRWDARTVWSFTISECISLDNMELYNDRNDIRVVWRDGSADVVWTGSHPYLTLAQGGSSGSNLNVSTAVGSPTQPATGPIPPTSLNFQAMVLRYDNDGFTYTGLPGDEKWVYDAPYYSEIEANTVGDNSLDVGQTWDSEGVKSLSLSFQGHPMSDGYYDVTAWPAYTIYGRGRNIWGRYDEFYFLSQYPFVGSGSIQTQVLSVENTHNGAKAGVMIREKWTPYSKYAAVFITPGQGVTFQYRDVEDGPSTNITKPGVTAPQYVKLERTISGAFEAKHSANGFVWEDVNAPDGAPVLPVIDMGTIADPNIYIGTAVTSHNSNQICKADFNNIVISTPPPNWIYGNIGTNDAEQLYVALSDGVNTDVVEHDDVNVATLTSWQEWNIPITDFTTVNLDAIKKVYIGFGDRDAPVQGGSGAIYVDDIRACPPRCIPAFRKPLYDIAQPYDCIVDEKDIRMVIGDWLVEATDPGTGNLVGWWKLDETTGATTAQDSSGYGSHGTLVAMDPASDWITGQIGGALHFDGIDDYVDCGDTASLQITGTSISLAAWVKYETAGNYSTIAMKTSSGDWADGYGLYADNAVVNFYVTDYENRATKSFSADNQWHHVVGTYDGSNVRVYVDGVEGTLFSYTSNISNAVHSFEIGRGADDAYNFSGALDDVRLYNAALTYTDVLGLLGSLSFLGTDLYEDMKINFKDYSLISSQFLDEMLWP